MDADQARRRWFGMFFLTLAAGMLIWGQTLLKPYITGIGFLVYWFLCFLFTTLAVITALLDVRALRRKTREDHRALLDRALGEEELRRRGMSGPKTSNNGSTLPVERRKEE